MAKHAKPTVTSALSKHGARSAAALAMASIGFLATAPSAFASGSYDQDSPVTYGEHDDDGIDNHESSGLINISDNDVLVPIQVCNNTIPVNVLGIQVPIEDLIVNVPIIPIDSESNPDTGDEVCKQNPGIED